MSIRIVVKNINEKYRLYVDSGMGYHLPAGDRLERGKPFPNDSWEYEDEEEAKEAARGLQLYIDTYEKRKKKGVRKNKRLEEQKEKLREHFIRCIAVKQCY
jgi:hypothetical protein